MRKISVDFPFIGGRSVKDQDTGPSLVLPSQNWKFEIVPPVPVHHTLTCDLFGSSSTGQRDKGRHLRPGGPVDLLSLRDT